jgi:hypothetical protein
MSSTLIQTCALCGLRYPNRALLELHIREDHPRHHQAAGEPHYGAKGSDTRTKMAAPQLRRPRPPTVLKAAQRGIHGLRTLSRQMANRIAATFGLEPWRSGGEKNARRS